MQNIRLGACSGISIFVATNFETIVTGKSAKFYFEESFFYLFFYSNGISQTKAALINYAVSTG